MPSAHRNPLSHKAICPEAGVHSGKSHTPAGKSNLPNSPNDFPLKLTQEEPKPRLSARRLGAAKEETPATFHSLGTAWEEINLPHGSYLFRQRGVLYFRMRVPQALRGLIGQTEYRRSLQTSSRKEARPKALRMALALDSIFTQAKETLFMVHASASSPQSGTPLTRERINRLVLSRLEAELQSGYMANLNRGYRSPAFQEKEYEVISSALAETLENIDTGIVPQDIKKLADTMLADHGIENPRHDPADEDGSGKQAYRLFCDKLHRAKAAAMESQIAGPCWDGSLRVAPDWSVSMAESFIKERNETDFAAPHVTPQQTALENGTVNQTAISIKEAVEKYIDERSKGWNSKATAMDTPKRLFTFLDIIGESMTFEAFAKNRDAMRRYHHIMTTIPAKYSKDKELKNLGWDELAALDTPPAMRFKKDTLKNNFNTVKGFLTWAGDEGYLERPAPFKKILNDLPADVEGDGKRAFTKKELAALFAPESFMTQKAGLDPKRPWKFLVPVLALFTGARIEEICQLDLADIRLERNEEQQGRDIWHIHVTDCDDSDSGRANTKSVKTKAGIRKVPLHPFLMGHSGSPVNILAYAESQRNKGETKLFPMLAPNKRGNYSDAVTKWFTRYRRECGVGGGEREYSEVTFHSFRHTLITTATKIKEVERRKVKQMVGHEAGLNEASDITTKYEGEYPLSTITRDVVGVLDFDRTLNLCTAFKDWRRHQQ